MNRQSSAALVAVVCGATLLSGCSSSGAAADSGTDAGVCTGPLAEVAAGCPATFDGDLGSLACPRFFTQVVSSCGDLTILSEGGGYTSVHCVYETAGGALVGAKLETDYNGYCEGRSFSKIAGRQPDQHCGVASATRMCPGADAAAEDGDARDGGFADAVSE